MEAGTDLLVGTPGRLIDYHRQHVLDLRSVEILVIDEADRMFDMGFIKDLRYLLRRLPPYDRRQSMLFSATLGFDVMELAYVFMNDAEKVSVTPEQVTAENIEHLVYHVGTHEKLPLLVGLLRASPGAHVLIFTNMKRTAERLERNLLANGFSAAAITGDVDQRRRLRILGEFKEGTLPILVATDVASRGLHIEGVTPRHQLRPAVRSAGLRAPRRPYGARGRVGARHHPRVRGVRRRARGHRGLHRLQAAARFPRRPHAGARPAPRAPSAARRSRPSRAHTAGAAPAARRARRRVACARGAPEGRRPGPRRRRAEEAAPPPAARPAGARLDAEAPRADVLTEPRPDGYAFFVFTTCSSVNAS